LRGASGARRRRVETGDLIHGGEGAGGRGRDVGEEGAAEVLAGATAVHALRVEALPVRGHGLFLGRRLDALAGIPVGADIVVQEGAEDVFDAVLPAELPPAAVVDPGALVLAVAALHLLVLARQDLFLEHLCALALVDTGHLEDLGSVEPAVGAAAHDGDAIDLHLVHGDARVDGLED